MNEHSCCVEAYRRILTTFVTSLMVGTCAALPRLLNVGPRSTHPSMLSDTVYTLFKYLCPGKRMQHARCKPTSTTCWCSPHQQNQHSCQKLHCHPFYLQRRTCADTIPYIAASQLAMQHAVVLTMHRTLVQLLSESGGTPRAALDHIYERSGHQSTHTSMCYNLTPSGVCAVSCCSVASQSSSADASSAQQAVSNAFAETPL